MMLLSLSLLTVRPRVVLVLWCLSLMNIVLFVVADATATAGDIFLSLFYCCFYATVLFPFPFSSTTDAEFFDTIVQTIVVAVCLLLLWLLFLLLLLLIPVPFAAVTVTIFCCSYCFCYYYYVCQFSMVFLCCCFAAEFLLLPLVVDLVVEVCLLFLFV